MDKVTDPEPIQNVSVTIIKGTGDGVQISDGTTATTPSAKQANVTLHVISPLMAILVRFGHNYVTMLVALIGAGMTTDVLPASDFMSLVTACAKLSVAGAGLAALKDVATIFGKLEGKFPLLTGGV